MQSKKEEKNFKNFFKNLFKFGHGLNIKDKSILASKIANATNDAISECIHGKQCLINGEIKYMASQPIGAVTDFSRSNLVVSLTDTEEKYSTEIFEPFIAKGYAVTQLCDYTPFAGYNVYLVSWK